MSKIGSANGVGVKQGGPGGIVEVLHQKNLLKKTLLKTGALQDAIFKSANFSGIATDEKGVIQIFNVGAERMPGCTAAEVAVRKAFLEFTETDAALWIVASGDLLTLAAQGWSALNTRPG